MIKYARLYVAGTDAGSLFTTPYYDNEGASFGLSLGSGVYAGEVITEFLAELAE